eukprot:jgi/Astpho2/2987/Aster-03298
MEAITPDAFIEQIGAGTVEHVSGDVFSDHLRAVQDVIRSYNVESPVVSAGLLHSIYGTEGFQDFQLSLDRREDVKQLVGERAEFIAFVNCVMDRATLDKQLDAPSGQHQVRARNQCGGALIPLTDQQHTDLITVHLGDWLEQVQRHAAKTDEGHQWLKKGDAWGYRRRAYRRMAELLGGRPLQHYDEVFRHEGPESKHINQELTPVITPKHAVIVN